METTANKNTATLIHLSALSQYFIPLGGLLLPAVLWSFKKNESEFVDYHGKQALNFQLSLFLYTILLIAIAVPLFLYRVFSNLDFRLNMNDEWIMEQFTLGEVSGLVIIGIVSVSLAVLIKVAELVLILYASVKSNNGEHFKFPLTINFIR